MGSLVFTYRTIIDAPIEQVWAFFSTADNLAKITTFPKVTILSNPETVEGNIIHLKLQVALLSVNWTSRISKVDHLSCFLDQGEDLPFPFTEWSHLHNFTKFGAHTIMEDVVNFKAKVPSCVTRPILQVLFKGRESAIKNELRQGK
ncbi:SRPBCC family protein [Halalkalibacter okhensis]|uniref:Cyclase n=1 Tax=Halalkalibacter okhensis TaxID=333138 RepID=A0A0B0IKH2_9BACI|nr:hypothetical protein [Halalkalibacter okhensis]KHF41790.1 hypothetical protein LQ50_00345 [Halalkalibacter okhensis]